MQCYLNRSTDISVTHAITLREPHLVLLQFWKHLYLLQLSEQTFSDYLLTALRELPNHYEYRVTKLTHRFEKSASVVDKLDWNTMAKLPQIKIANEFRSFAVRWIQVIPLIIHFADCKPMAFGITDKPSLCALEPMNYQIHHLHQYLKSPEFLTLTLSIDSTKRSFVRFKASAITCIP